MYGQLLLKALSDKYNAEISDAMARLNICLGTPQSAPEGAGVVDLMDTLVAQAATAEQRLAALQRYTAPAPAPPALPVETSPVNKSDTKKVK